MKIMVRILILLCIAFLFSCEEKGVFINCNDCKSEEPLDATLEIRLNGSGVGTPIVIRVYEGNLEDNILDREFTTQSSSTSVTVSINRKYTVTATYGMLDGTYTTVDSVTPKVKYTTDQCDEPCYYVYDRKLDLRLK